MNSIKNEAQLINNSIAIAVFTTAMNELEKQDDCSAKRLRTCSAKVWETENFFILQSYETFVAVVDKASRSLVDVLRYVYGYTNTSAHHISKFRHDYTPYPWDGDCYVYRKV